MNTHTHQPFVRLFAMLALAALAAAACSPTPTPVAQKSAPTRAVTKAPPTVAPTVKVLPTTAPKATAAAQADQNPAAKLGTAWKLGDLSVNATQFQQLTAAGPDKPKDGDVFVVVNLTLENAGKTAIKFDPASLTLLDPSGASISLTTLASVKDELSAQSLKPGAKISGTAVFEVPQKATGLELEFKAANNENALWSLAS